MFAGSAVAASSIATRVLFAGKSLQHFHASYLAVLLLGLVVILGPMLVFVPALLRLKDSGVLRHGALASHHAQLFEARWMTGRGEVDPSILGSPDVQTLADFVGSHETVWKIRPVPFDRSDLVILAAAGMLPAMPLLTTSVPVREFL